MGIMSFFKEAGEKLFGHKDTEAAAASAQAAPGDAALQAAATVSGTAADQATKEKITLCCGSVTGVAQVNDLMTVAEPAAESQFHTVVRGETLSAIAKTYYGNANQYMKIFEANRPMLGHPDKIYPGQLLRIPT